MFTRILVPLDQSPRAERALPVAARLARASGGAVILVEVVQAPVEFEIGAAPSATWAPAANPAERKAATQYLSRRAAGPELAGLDVRTGVYAGPVAAMLLLAADSHQADMIVMTSRGLRGLARWALGSVAEKVVRHAPVPVLLVRDRDPLPLGPHPDPDRPLRVLVPLDGSAVSETVLVPAALAAAALSAPGRAAMHLFRVMDALEGAFMPERPGGTAQFGAEVRERALREGSAYLSAIVERLRTAVPRDLDVEVTWSVVASEEYAASGADVARAILDAAEAGELAGGGAAPGRCDLIAMATHGRGGLARWAMGSITERVLHAASLPMLIVRAHAAAPAAPSP